MPSGLQISLKIMPFQCGKQMVNIVFMVTSAAAPLRHSADCRATELS
jgi:hypothetical protein